MRSDCPASRSDSQQSSPHWASRSCLPFNHGNQRGSRRKTRHPRDDSRHRGLGIENVVAGPRRSRDPLSREPLIRVRRRYSGDPTNGACSQLGCHSDILTTLTRSTPQPETDRRAVSKTSPEIEISRRIGLVRHTGLRQSHKKMPLRHRKHLQRPINQIQNQESL